MPSFRRRASVIDDDHVDQPKQDPDRSAGAADALALAEEAEAEAAEADAIAAAARARARAIRLRRQAQAAVIGVPDERLGQVGKAFIVTKADDGVTADELIAWSRDRMAGFKVPRFVAFADELPLNATGKVMKDKLS